MQLRLFSLSVLYTLITCSIALANEANISGIVYPGPGSGAGGPVYVLVSDSPVFPGGNDFGSQLLPDVGDYKIFDVPRGVDLYIHAIYDADNSESYTVGDWKGTYSTSPINLPSPSGTLENPGYDVPLTTEVVGASVSGGISYADYSSGNIYVGALDDSDNLLGYATLTSLGSYTIPNLPVDGKLGFFAFVDTDGSGPTTGPTGSDPIGIYPANPVTVPASGMAGIDIDIQSPSNISGRIYESGSNTPIGGACVTAEANKCGGGLVSETTTQADGTYQLQVPEGTYYIRTNVTCDDNSTSTNKYYVDEVYDGIDGTSNCNNGISVTVGPDASHIDFSLVKGGTISGTMYDNAEAPITGYGQEQGYNAGVSVFTGECGSADYVGSGVLLNDGGFTTDPLPAGDYKLQTNMGRAPYIDEYWAAPVSDTNCGSAQPISVSTGTDSSGKNFQLDPARTITGTVATGNPATGVSGLLVEAGAGSNQRVSVGITDNSGNYFLKVPVGQYKVFACATCEEGSGPFPYVDEYWDNQTNIDNASIVDVSESDKSGINFILGETYNPTDPGEPDLADTIKALQILTGSAPSEIDAITDDVNGDGKIGLAEAIHTSQFVIEKPKIPILALLVAKGVDKVEMAWAPGSDGVTPVDQVQYNIYLSTTEDFVVSPATLKKSVTGTNQTEITGLETDTTYYGKVVAVYSASASMPSNSLQTKTYKQPVQQDSTTTVAIADDLNLGKYTTDDNITYSFADGITPPEVGSVLISENTAGGMTLRTVDSVAISGGTITVNTSDASLNDVLDRGSLYSSFKLFDISSQAQDLPATSGEIATARSLRNNDGSLYSHIDWKNGLLSAEQTDYAYDKATLSVKPQGTSSLLTLKTDATSSSTFTASVAANFKPKLITRAEWGGNIVKHLDSAKVAATGTLSLTAEAEFDFSSFGTASNEFLLFKRTWTSVYSAGPVPVYQKITLSMNVAASATAQTALQAMAKTSLVETVEVGATYNGTTWTPYISHNESDSLTAELDIAGEASAEIRLIPKIAVEYYKVLNSSLTVEPLAQTSLKFAETTHNIEFLAAHPNRSLQITSFDASLGLESNVAVNLNVLGQNWDILPTTCVLGAEECIYKFVPVDLFSVPKFALSVVSSDEHQTVLQLRVTDGTLNTFKQSSLIWEVFPNDTDTSITPGSCLKSGTVTTCEATVTPGHDDKYTVFASGHGNLGEGGRQFVEQVVVECHRSVFNDDQGGQGYSSVCDYPHGQVLPHLAAIQRTESSVHHVYSKEVYDVDQTGKYWSVRADKLSSGSYNVEFDNGGIDNILDSFYTGSGTSPLLNPGVCPPIDPEEYPDFESVSASYIYRNTPTGLEYIWKSECIVNATENQKIDLKIEAYNQALDLLPDDIGDQINDGACQTWWNYIDELGVLHQCTY